MVLAQRERVESAVTYLLSWLPARAAVFLDGIFRRLLDGFGIMASFKQVMLLFGYSVLLWIPVFSPDLSFPSGLLHSGSVSCSGHYTGIHLSGCGSSVRTRIHRHLSRGWSLCVDPFRGKRCGGGIFCNGLSPVQFCVVPGLRAYLLPDK